MNQEIQQAAWALAEEIALSPEFQTMQQREEEALEDEALQGQYREFLQLRQQIQEEAGLDQPDKEKLGTLSADLERVQGLIQGMDSMVALNDAREAFSTLMERVNIEIQQVLHPDDDDEEGGCGSAGGCAGCSGCGPR